MTIGTSTQKYIRAIKDRFIYINKPLINILINKRRNN